MNGNRLSERLRESIEEEIATGKLLPGTRLRLTAAVATAMRAAPAARLDRLRLGVGLPARRAVRALLRA